MRCELRHGIEILKVGQSGHGFVMIAANDDRRKFPYTLGHFVGVGPVIDDVAQGEDAFPTILHRFEGGIERRGIRMNIAEQEKSHL